MTELRRSTSNAPTDPAAAFLNVVESSSVIVWTTDIDGVCTTCCGKGLEAAGMVASSVVGRNMFEVFAERTDMIGCLVRALGGESSRTLDASGTAHFETWFLPTRAADGSITGTFAIGMEATGTVGTEQPSKTESRVQANHPLITPIIQIWDEVLCLPVVGVVDSARAAEMMDALLQSIVREQARYAIVDLTGVDVVDTSTADHLMRLFRAAKVLGVDGVLCGIRPAVAQTVVALGLDLTSIRTKRSLRDALKWCIGARALAAKKEEQLARSRASGTSRESP